MARIRTLYNNEAIFVAQWNHDNVSTEELALLERVQSFDISVNIPLEDVNEFARLASIARINLEGAEVSAKMSYLLVDYTNEVRMGLVVKSDEHFISDLIKSGNNYRQYFKVVADEGIDVINENPANAAALGMGNMYISSYSMEGAVGGYVTTTTALTGESLVAYEDASSLTTPELDNEGIQYTDTYVIANPMTSESSIYKQPVLKAGDLKLTLTKTGGPAGTSEVFAQDPAELTLQSFNLSVDLAREPVRKLGAPLPIARPVTFPLSYTLQVELLAGDIVEDNIQDYLCGNVDIDARIDMFVPDCSEWTGDAETPAVVVLKNLNLQSQDFSTSIGPNATISATFQGQIGGANDTENGIYFSGVTGYEDGAGGDEPSFST